MGTDATPMNAIWFTVSATSVGRRKSRRIASHRMSAASPMKTRNPSSGPLTLSHALAAIRASIRQIYSLDGSGGQAGKEGEAAIPLAAAYRLSRRPVLLLGPALSDGSQAAGDRVLTSIL